MSNEEQANDIINALLQQIGELGQQIAALKVQIALSAKEANSAVKEESTDGSNTV